MLRIQQLNAAGFIIANGDIYFPFLDHVIMLLMFFNQRVRKLD